MQVELNPEIEARLVADALAEGLDPAVYAGSVIERVYGSAHDVRRSLRQPEQVRAWLDSLAHFSEDIPQLPDEAFTRASFYRKQD